MHLVGQLNRPVALEGRTLAIQFEVPLHGETNGTKLVELLLAAVSTNRLVEEFSRGTLLLGRVCSPFLVEAGHAKNGQHAEYPAHEHPPGTSPPGSILLPCHDRAASSDKPVESVNPGPKATGEVRQFAHDGVYWQDT